MFQRVGFCFSAFLIISFAHSALPPNCTSCQVRVFTQKSKNCSCPVDTYCEITNKDCKKCGKCYDKWNRVVEHTKDNIQTILKDLIKKYEANLNDSQSLLNVLTRNELKSQQLDMTLNQMERRIKTVENDLYDLAKDLEKIKNMISNDIRSPKELNSYLNGIIEKLKKLERIKKNFEFYDIDKLKEINNSVKNLTKRIPEFERNSLNLALSVKSDLEFFDFILSKFGNESDGKIQDTRWVEKEILWLFTALNQFGNTTAAVNDLIQSVNETKKSLETLANEIDNLLKKHNDFKKIYNKLLEELKFYKEIWELNRHLDQLIQGINSLLSHIKNLNLLDEWNKALQEFEEEKQKNEEEKQKIEDLKNKLQILCEEDGLYPITTQKIKEFEKEVSKIVTDITNHCKL